jgi:hypothetical protein
MVMRKLFTVCAFLLAFSLAVFSQDDYHSSDSSEASQSEKAEKIDEFGRIGECDMRARLDGFLSTLQNTPNLRGVVITYQGKDVLPANYDSTARLYENHFRFRNFDTNRIEIISGSFREERFTELWTVPNGIDSPTPTETIPKPTIPSGKTFLYDRNHISGREEGDFSEEFILPSVKAQQEAEQRAYEEENQPENTDEETAVEDTIQTVEAETEIEKPSPEEIEETKFHWTNEKFGELIKNQKDSGGVIIFYADDAYFDVGKLQSHIENGKRRIAEVAKISPDKIQVVFGGYRHSIEAEFWIVPKKGESPKPTPEERPIEEIENEIN